MKSPPPASGDLEALQSRSGVGTCQTEVIGAGSPLLLAEMCGGYKVRYTRKLAMTYCRNTSFSWTSPHPNVWGLLLLCTILSLPSLAQSSAPVGDPQALGSISATVVDASGAVVSGAHIKLTREGQTEGREAISGDDGRFSFDGVALGPSLLTISADGFETQITSATLHPGEILTVPQITLPVATAMTEVKVGLTVPEIAEEEIKVEEKQRVLGVIPNFYISYVPNAAPLSTKQKFKLAWKTTTDPVSFGIVGVIAGIQQSQNAFSGYGQGAQGYGKRYGAAYADLTSGTFIGAAILPSVLKQDPRYFYKGTGSKRSRTLYAIANAVICKGDNGRWQTNYSSILGSFAAGGISNLYYPASDRRGATLTVETALIGIGASAAANIIEEFFSTKITTNVPKQDPAKP